MNICSLPEKYHVGHVICKFQQKIANYIKPDKKVNQMNISIWIENSEFTPMNDLLIVVKIVQFMI